MKIELMDLKDQKGRLVFKENIELVLPTQPFIQVGDNLREHFYGDSDTTRIMDYIELMKKGYVIASVVWNPHWRKMFPNQKEFFLIKKRGSLEPREVVVPKLPSKIWINYDLVNKKVRLEGRGTGFAGRGLWIKI